MKYNNCLFYAIYKWLKEGGCIKVRPSKSFKYVPHFIHKSKSGVLNHWTPIRPKKGWKVMFYKVWFKGKVKHEDC